MQYSPPSLLSESDAGGLVVAEVWLVLLGLGFGRSIRQFVSGIWWMISKDSTNPVL
jgi:hypothetical protein